MEKKNAYPIFSMKICFIKEKIVHKKKHNNNDKDSFDVCQGK